MYALILLAIAADNEAIPANIREYFKRADTEKQKLIDDQAAAVSDIQVAINGERNRTRKGILRQKLKAAELALDLAKTTKPTSLLPHEPAKDDVGTLPKGQLWAIIDNDTALLRTANLQTIVLKTDTKHLTVGKQYHTQELWQVTKAHDRFSKDPETSFSSIDKDLFRQIQYTNPNFIYFVTPIRQAEASRYRQAYDAETTPK